MLNNIANILPSIVFLLHQYNGSLGPNALEAVAKLESFSVVLDPTFREYLPTVTLSLNCSIEKIISYAGIKSNIYAKKHPTNSMVTFEDPLNGKYLSLSQGLQNDVLRILSHKVFFLELLFLVYDLYDILEEDTFEKGLREGKKKSKSVQKYKSSKMKILFYVSFLLWVDSRILQEMRL